MADVLGYPRDLWQTTVPEVPWVFYIAPPVSISRCIPLVASVPWGANYLRVTGRVLGKLYSGPGFRPKRKDKCQ